MHSSTYWRIIIHQVIFAVSIPNVWGTIDKFATQCLQPWASRALCNSAREVDWCPFHLKSMFVSQVPKFNPKGMCACYTLLFISRHVVSQFLFHNMLYPVRYGQSIFLKLYWTNTLTTPNSTWTRYSNNGWLQLYVEHTFTTVWSWRLLKWLGAYLYHHATGTC